MQAHEKFSLGFWQYLTFAQLQEGELLRCAAEWKELSMNVAYSFWYDPQHCREEQMLALLDSCLQNGLQLIVVHSKLHWNELRKAGAEAYEEGAKQIIARFGQHPACFGFMVGDEPDARNWEDAKLAVKLVQRNTEKVAFVNFNPPWFGEEFEKKMGFRGEEYARKLESFIAETGLKVLCYDFYGGMCTHRRTYQINAHFRNLAIMRAVAAKAGIPCWNSGLCIGHWDFRLPHKDDLRWMLATSVAHGIRGVLWFELYQNRDPAVAFRENWEGAPYDPFGEKTRTWYDLRDIQREFCLKYGDAFSHLEWEEVHHYGCPYGGHYYYFDGCDPHVARFTARFGTDATLARFRDRRTGELVYMVVNNSQEQKDGFTIGFSAPYAHCGTSRWLNPGGSFLVRLKKEENE